MPSHEKSAYLVKPDDSFKKIIIADLNINDKSSLQFDGKNINGTWTMIYNEGFDILAEKYSFFTFNKYTKDKFSFKDVWQSMCYATLVGFYHKGESHWGCFYAEKIGEDPNKITNNDVKDKLLVVEGTVKKVSNMKFKQENNVFENVNFLQSQEKEMLVLDAKFKDHSKVVDKINSMNGLWKAKNYDEYSNLSIEELNTLAGKKRYNRKFGLIKNKKHLSSKSIFNSEDLKRLSNPNEKYKEILK